MPESLAIASRRSYAEAMPSLPFQCIKRLISFGVLVMAILAPALAWAQTAAPSPTLKNVPAPWVGYLLMAVLLIIVLGVSLMPSKRSHQD